MMGSLSIARAMELFKEVEEAKLCILPGMLGL